MSVLQKSARSPSTAGAIMSLFVADEGAERFAPATRFTIIAGGSALLWATLLGLAMAVRS